MTSIATTPLPTAGSRTRFATWLHRYAIGVSCCTLLLIMIGSTVTTTGSGLAVPDWPATYGQNMFTYPPSEWVGGIFYEHGHRLVASLVGLLTIGLCVGLWCSAHARWLKWLGTAALVAVCLQGVLGGLTVLYHLPTPVSVAHASLAELFLCMTVVIAAATSPRWGTVHWTGNPVLKYGLVVLGCVYLQIVAGAIMRHTGSSLAITDFPLSYGNVLPPTDSTALAAINEERVWSAAELEPVSLLQVWLHFAHRAGALVVALAVIVAARRLLRDPTTSPRAALLVMGLVLLIIAQVVLGGLAIWTARSLAISTAHIGAGALMLATALGLVLALTQQRAPTEMD